MTDRKGNTLKACKQYWSQFSSVAHKDRIKGQNTFGLLCSHLGFFKTLKFTLTHLHVFLADFKINATDKTTI